MFSFSSSLQESHPSQSHSLANTSSIISFQSDHQNSIYNNSGDKIGVQSKESSVNIQELQKIIERSKIQPIQNVDECIKKIEQMKIFSKLEGSSEQSKQFSKRRQINQHPIGCPQQTNILQNVLHQLYMDHQQNKDLQLQKKNTVPSEKYDSQQLNQKQNPQIQQFQNIININNLSISTIAAEHQKVQNHAHLTFKEKLEMTKKMFGEQFVRNLKHYSQIIEKQQKKQQQNKQMSQLVRNVINKLLKDQHKDLNRISRQTQNINENVVDDQVQDEVQYDQQPKYQNTQQKQSKRYQYNRVRPNIFGNQNLQYCVDEGEEEDQQELGMQDNQYDDQLYDDREIFVQNDQYNDDDDYNYDYYDDEDDYY